MKLSQEEKLRRKEERRQRKFNETHKLINNIDYKICNHCKEWLPCNEEYFYKVKNDIDGLRPDCKECTKRKSTEWRKNPENKEKFKENRKRMNAKKSQKEHNRRILEIRKNNGYSKGYYNHNKEIFKKYRLNREMNKKHEISDDEWENCKNYFNYRCGYCGLPVEEHFRIHYGEMKQFDLHKEHVNHTGANDLSNCIPSCQSCNSSKWVHSLDDWYNDENENFSQEKLDKIHKWLNEDYIKYKE